MSNNSWTLSLTGRETIRSIIFTHYTKMKRVYTDMIGGTAFSYENKVVFRVKHLGTY